MIWPILLLSVNTDLITTTARVNVIHGQVAWLNTEPSQACQLCRLGASTGCTRRSGFDLRHLVSGERHYPVAIADNLTVNPGEQVLIVTEVTTFLWALGIVYGLPMFGLILGAGLGQFTLHSEWVAIVGGFLGFIIGVINAVYLEKKLERLQKIKRPSILKTNSEAFALDKR